jgi:hypothetical protein
MREALTMPNKLLIAIYRLGVKDQLGWAEDDDLMKELGIDRDELNRLSTQLDQLGYLDMKGVSIGSFKLSGAGFREAERLLARAT